MEVGNVAWPLQGPEALGTQAISSHANTSLALEAQGLGRGILHLRSPAGTVKPRSQLLQAWP